MYYPTNEKVAEVTVGSDKVYLFPRYAGGTVVDAVTQANGVLRGRDSAFVLVHTGTDRNTSTRYLNLLQATFIDYKMVSVPTEITKLYTSSADESAKETVRAYFETK